eukprot:TRINITY_DN3247_c0_g1_i1.p1 TRINITY_DN3247_c0_g1~~TRINITY_DN3247_c0_g1_i1.p1  ORF type:complete len:256 (-),score=69.09 TRINITY_DN3247_c0_g1_i1:84-851(-)
MRRVFGVKKEKGPTPTIEESNDRLNKRGESVDQKVAKLDAELAKYRDQIKRTRPGPAQEALKARAMRLLRQRKMFEGQRDNLYNQSFNLEQVAFASEGMKDAQQTMAAMKGASKELKGQMKQMKIDDVDKMQDDMMDLMDYSNDIQESLGRSYGVPDDIDDEELMGELDALEADMGSESTSEGLPAYLQQADEPAAHSLESELSLPTAPHGRAQAEPLPAYGGSQQQQQAYAYPGSGGGGGQQRANPTPAGTLRS